MKWYWITVVTILVAGICAMAIGADAHLQTGDDLWMTVALCGRTATIIAGVGIMAPIIWALIILWSIRGVEAFGSHLPGPHPPRRNQEQK